MIELLLSRAYIGAPLLITFFLLTAWTVFVPLRRGLGLPIRGHVAELALCTLSLYALGLYAGVKPGPPPGPPPGPQLSEYAKIYARPEFGGSPTNTVHGLRPAGTLEVK